jgi:hypothetical protein
VGGWEDKGGVWVYEAHEVKNKREKVRCLLLRLKKIFFLYYDVITSPGKKTALLITTPVFPRTDSGEYKPETLNPEA